MAGPGERCMFCSGSESSDIEHFRPKSVFPHLAMTWENYLWTFTVCNRYKGNRFASETQLNDELINPVDENVWSFFYIDRFGNLTPQWRVDINDFDPRAVLTQTILRLDRQALQESRQSRRRELISRIEDSIARFHSKELTVEDLRHRWKEWLLSPAQPDVADYYLNGPGIIEEPFAKFLSLIQNA